MSNPGWRVSCGLDLPTVPQPRAVPHPTIVFSPVVMTGLPAAPVGVIVSMLTVVRVTVVGTVAVSVTVTVLVAPPLPPGLGVVVVGLPERGVVVDVLSTPLVMMPVLFTPGG